MSTKIQINSLEALERLIGGDSEIEIEIRNSVVQNFANKHLKAVASHELLSGIRNEISKEIDSLIYEKKPSALKPYKTLSPIARELVQSAVNSQMTGLIYEAARNAIDTAESVKRMNSLIDTYANDIAERVSKEVIEKRIDALVDKKLREKLGIS